MRFLKQVSLYLTAMMLASCASFPELHPHKLVLSKNVCGEYKQVSTKPIRFQFVKWHPLNKCEGYFAFPPEDVANVRKWCASTEEAKEYCPR